MEPQERGLAGSQLKIKETLSNILSENSLLPSSVILCTVLLYKDWRQSLHSRFQHPLTMSPSDSKLDFSNSFAFAPLFIFAPPFYLLFSHPCSIFLSWSPFLSFISILLPLLYTNVIFHSSGLCLS